MVDHPVILRGISNLSPGSGPTILQRTDQDFIGAILAELAQPDRWEALGRAIARTPDLETGVLKLYQPVHRVFHLVLLEAVCDPVNLPSVQPRLEPQKIDSAGLVLRRLAVNRQGQLAPNRLEGWRQMGSRLRGWVAFTGEESDPNADLKLDPDRDRRPQLQAGQPELSRRLSLLQASGEQFSETVSPLFVAPPQVCEAAQKTILYGLIPVTSSELSEAEEPLAFSPDFIRNHLPTYLRAANSTKSLPRANQTLYANAAVPIDNPNRTQAQIRDDNLLQDFISMLRQLQFEFEAFGDKPDSKLLFAVLNQIQLPFNDNPPKSAGSFLQEAANILVDRATGSVKMPREWPAVSTSTANAIQTLVKTILDRRLAIAQPQQRRFDEQNRQYQVRAFIRIKRPDGCPPKLVWSPNSEPFRIVPWYESSDTPPVQVTLPDILAPGALAQLKPNVTFAVPSNLFNLLGGMNLKDLLDGKKPSSGGPVLDWICGFNIPIITICAFIVLNIFLQLLNIIFFWLPFVKICIPFPRSSEN